MWKNSAIIILGFFILILQFCQTVLGFNLNVGLAKTFVGDQTSQNSLFGYTVDFLRTRESQPKNWILVGAPRSQDRFQPGLTEPGALFKCDPDSTTCEQVKVADGGNTQAQTTDRDDIVHHKDNAWFGASLAVGDAVMVCAPRWRDDIETIRNQNPLTHMSGICYELPRILDFNSRGTYAFLSEGVKDKWTQSYPQNFSDTGTYYNYMHGQMGMSVRPIDQDSSRLVIGAPGLSDANGGVINFDANTQIGGEPFSPDRNNDYFGYAVMPGKYMGDGQVYIALGGPRGKGAGQVKILGRFSGDTYEVMANGIINGEEAGSYFGSVLCAVDVDRNKKDVLVVGAPFFGNLTVVNFDSTFINQDEGKVYVYSYDRSLGKFVEVQQLRGSNSKNSRFGSALSSPGDINVDSANDLIVGAPYEDDGKGAIYVYNGYQGKFWPRPTQIIKASNIDSGLRGFGMYMSQFQLDVDDNSYKDLVIGAPWSNKVIMLRSNPTLAMEVSLNTTLVNSIITEETKGFNIKVCFLYTGDRTAPDVTVNYTVFIDYNRTLDNKRERVIAQDGGNTISGEKKIFTSNANAQCDVEFPVLVQSYRDDIVSPVAFMVKYAIKHQSGTGVDCTKDPCPIISMFDARRQVPDTEFFHKMIDFKKPGCGDDNRCDTDLSLSARPTFNYGSDVLIRGPDAGFQLDVTVENNGEAAYATDLMIHGPYFISYVKVTSAPGYASEVTCSPRNVKDDTETFLECGLSNSEVPFKAGKVDKFIIYFVASVAPVIESFKMEMELKTRSNEINMANNKVSFTTPIQSKVDVIFGGVANPELFVTSKTKTDSIVHLFDLNNKGPSILDSPTTLAIKYPSVTLKSKDLLKVTNLTITVPIDIRIFDCGTEYNKEIVVLQSDSTGKDSKVTYLLTEKNPSTDDRLQFNCERASCKKVECRISPLTVNSIVTVRLSYRMDPDILALVKGGKTSELLESQNSEIENLPILSVATATLPNNIRLISDSSYSAIAKTDVLPAEQKAEKVAWWVYLLGVLGALILLAIIVAVCWKFGFFKRKEFEELKNRKQSQHAGPPADDQEKLVENGKNTDKKDEEEEGATGEKADVSEGFTELDKMLKIVEDFA